MMQFTEDILLINKYVIIARNSNKIGEKNKNGKKTGPLVDVQSTLQTSEQHL